MPPKNYDKRSNDRDSRQGSHLRSGGGSQPRKQDRESSRGRSVGSRNHQVNGKVLSYEKRRSFERDEVKGEGGMGNPEKVEAN